MCRFMKSVLLNVTSEILPLNVTLRFKINQCVNSYSVQNTCISQNETHKHDARRATLHASVKLWGEYAKDA